MHQIGAAPDGSAAGAQLLLSGVSRRGCIVRAPAHEISRRPGISSISDVARLSAWSNERGGRGRDLVRATQVGEESGFVDPDLTSGAVDLQIAGLDPTTYRLWRHLSEFAASRTDSSLSSCGLVTSRPTVPGLRSSLIMGVMVGFSIW